MRRITFAVIGALMFISPAAISRLGHFSPLEKPAQAQEKSKKEKSKDEKPKEEKPTQPQEQPKDVKPTQAQDQPKGDVAAGKALYATSCKKCHGPNGEGVPRMYRLVQAKIVHLGSQEAQAQSDDFIRKSMTDGYKKMEPIKDPRPLTPEEVGNILVFVRTLKQ